MNARSGSWWLISKTDPRWNSHGSTKFCGGFCMPKECEDKLAELILELGAPLDENFEYPVIGHEMVNPCTRAHRRAAQVAKDVRR